MGEKNRKTRLILALAALFQVALASVSAQTTEQSDSLLRLLSADYIEQVEIDEDLLRNIAETTGGRYFRATDNTKLSEIYSEINRMEKSKTSIDSFPVYKELFSPFAIAALLCLLAELLVRILLRRMP